MVDEGSTIYSGAGDQEDARGRVAVTLTARQH